MTLETSRRTRRLAASALALSVGLCALAAPTAAQAAYTQYALYYPAYESVPKYSAVATVRGGKAYTNNSTSRTYLQTLSGGVLLASAYAAGSNPVNMSHVPYSGAQSRCYWDFLGGTVPGNPTVPINCWRLT